MRPHLTTLVITGTAILISATASAQSSVRLGNRGEDPGRAMSNWVDWVDETGERLDAAAQVCRTDTHEKDYWVDDFDQDGDDDVVVARKMEFSTIGGLPNLLLMNENGVLVDRTAQYIPSFSIADDSRDIVAFDANGDGWLDLVTATTWFDTPRLWISQGEDMNGDFLGWVEDTAWFTPAFSPGPLFCAVNFGDVDNDTDLDLFFSDYDNTLEDRLLINDGTGKFTDETVARMSFEAYESQFGTGNFIHDFNKDGWADILKGGAGVTKLCINDGAGNFNQVQIFPTIGAYMVRSADFNNDDRMDWYTVDDGFDYMYINNSTTGGGNLNTTKITLLNAPNAASLGGNVDAADVDLDGYLDMGVCDVDIADGSCARTFGILRNTEPDGTLELVDPNGRSRLPWNTHGTYDIAWIDIDQDGYKDLITGTCSGTQIWMMIPFPLPGAPYCASLPNSSGERARLNASGSTSVEEADLRLCVEGGVSGQIGFFYYGAERIQVPRGGGFGCVGGPIYRLPGASKIGASYGLCSKAVDFESAPVRQGPGVIEAGSTWNFQFWYRDPGSPGGHNLTDGLSVTFTP